MLEDKDATDADAKQWLWVVRATAFFMIRPQGRRERRLNNEAVKRRARRYFRPMPQMFRSIAARTYRRFLAETINQVRKGRLSSKIANTVGYLSSLLMKALERSDIEERLVRVEQVLKTRKPDEWLFDP